MPSPSTALVNITALNTVTLQDAFQFDPDATDWDFTGQSFKMEVKASSDDTVALVTWTSAGGTIVVDSISERVLHLNVSEAVLQAGLPAGVYVYDLVMYDASPTPVRVALMQGSLCIEQGVTES